MNFNFTEDWYTRNAACLISLVEQFQPKTVLEIGSFEGRSACAFLVQKAGVQLTCIDPWEDDEIKQRFDANILAALAESPESACRAVRGYSARVLPRLAVEGNRFDMIYIDGSHRACDVLRDAVMAFDLCSVGGLMVFDDYLWGDRRDVLGCPKPGIDAFTTCFAQKIEIVQDMPLWQLYVRKLCD
jgi:predicted O-methyltransferase YrrM